MAGEDRPDDQARDPLRASLMSRVAELCLDGYYEFRGKHYPYWNHWGLYLDKTATELVINAMLQLMQIKLPGVAALCPIPTSGFPIGALLFSRSDVQMLASFHWKDSAFHFEDTLRAKLDADRAHPGTVCAVDSSVHSGSSLFQCSKVVNARLDRDLSGILAIVNNDLIDSCLLDPMKAEFLESGRLHALFRVSELETVWSRRNEDFMRNRREDDM